MTGSRALAELFKAEAPRLRHSLSRMKSVSAEDIVQESFARLCAVDAATIETPSAYLYQTAFNLARSEIRRQKQVPMTAMADPDALGLRSKEKSPEDTLEHAEEMLRLREAVENLPGEFRVPLVLAKVEGRSAKEIAAHLGLTDRIVYHRIAEAIARLHIAMTKKR